VKITRVACIGNGYDPRRCKTVRQISYLNWSYLKREIVSGWNVIDYSIVEIVVAFPQDA